MGRPQLYTPVSAIYLKSFLYYLYVFLLTYIRFCTRICVFTRTARVLTMALCTSVCVCLSVTSRSSIETDEQIKLILA